MKTYLISFILSFTLLMILTPFLIFVGKRYGFVDHINRRKIHRGLIPRIGGIGIAIGTLLPIALLRFHNNDISELFFSEIGNSVVVLGGAMLISLMGLVDDIKEISAKYKFIIQILVATVAWYFGFSISKISIPFFTINLGIFSLPITVLWIVGIINAFNLIDGLDGLSSGLAFFASIVSFVVAVHNNLLFPALISASLAGAVVGFLVFNFNPAKIFMGDSGSMFIGFLLAVVSLKSSTKNQAIVSLLIPIMAMGVPIIDTTMAFVRRFLRNQPIFQADRQHIHHILLAKGWTQKKVVLVIYGISLIFTAIAMSSIFLNDIETFLMIIVFLIIIVVVIQKLGYLEMFYQKYTLRKEKSSLEKELENTFLNRIKIKELDDFVEEFLSLDSVKGIALLKENGKEIFKKGEEDKINFIDIKTAPEIFIRIFWENSVPAISSKESVMIELLSKSLLNFIEKNEAKK